MKIPAPSSLFAITLIAAAVLAGCSSSSDDEPPVGDTASQTTDGASTSGADGQPGGASPDAAVDDTTGVSTDDAGEAPTDDSAGVLVDDAAGVSVDDPSGGAPDDAAAFALDRSADALITSLAGYQIETLTEEAMLLAESVVAAGGGTELAPGTVSVDANIGPVEEASVRTEYACPLGGTVVADIGRIAILESSYSNTADQDRYDFDQCRLETDGVQVLDGTVRTWVNSVSASRGGFANSDAQWTAFSWQQGETGDVSGTTLVEVRELLSFDNDGFRNVTFDDYERRRGGATIERVSDSDLSLRIGTSGSGALQIYGLRAAGTVSDASDVDVRVATEQMFSAELPVPAFDGQGTALTGMMSLEADGGARLTLTASPDVTQVGPKRVDRVYTDAAGTTTRTEGFLPEFGLR